MKFTKHFYIEGQRIVSKIGEMGEYKDMLNPKDTLKAGGDKVNWDKKKDNQKAQLIANFEALGLDGALFTAGKSGKVPYGRIKKYFRENDGLVNGGDSPANMDTISSGGNKPEKLQFYYHPDHLGSSSYITDISGEVYQHMEYFPFGETFIEERTDAAYTSYLFNGKELDEETGLYYYGARYYDSRISMWYGVDKLTEKYPDISPFSFVSNNPLLYVDPDGNAIRIFYEGGYFDFNGTNYNQAPKNKFVNNVLTAYNYNTSNGGGKNMQEAAFSKKIVGVKESNTASSAPSGGAIEWNPQKGSLKIAVDENGNERWVVTSPATGLEHEFDHKSNEKIKDDLLAEESRVISGSETRTAQANGEIKESEKIKNSYNFMERMGVIISGNPTSTAISVEGTKELIRMMDENGRETKQYKILQLDD